MSRPLRLATSLLWTIGGLFVVVGLATLAAGVLIPGTIRGLLPPEVTDAAAVGGAAMVLGAVTAGAGLLHLVGARRAAHGRVDELSAAVAVAVAAIGVALLASAVSATVEVADAGGWLLGVALGLGLLGAAELAIASLLAVARSRSGGPPHPSQEDRTGS